MSAETTTQLSEVSDLSLDSEICHLNESLPEKPDFSFLAWRICLPLSVFSMFAFAVSFPNSDNDSKEFLVYSSVSIAFVCVSVCSIVCRVVFQKEHLSDLLASLFAPAFVFILLFRIALDSTD